MGIRNKSMEWLINRANYLREKIRAYEIILNSIRSLQMENRDSMAFVEACEAAIKTVESQKEYTALSLKTIEEEIDRRTVRTPGATPSSNSQ
ncbi:MAG: hypothetical protein QXF58_06845 [Desulfurococcaceae archaeon]